MVSVRCVLVLAIATFAVGCGDPLVGDWQSKGMVNCPSGGTDRTKFTVDSDLQAEGSTCGCAFAFDATNEGDGLYTVDVAFEADCGLFVLLAGPHDCTLVGDLFDCDELGRYNPAP